MAFALLPSGLIAAAGQMVEELSGRAAPSLPQPPRQPPWLAFAPYERFRWIIFSYGNFAGSTSLDYLRWIR